MSIYTIISVQVMRERKSQYRASRSGGIRIAPAELKGTMLPSHEKFARMIYNGSASHVLLMLALKILTRTSEISILTENFF